MNRITEVKLIGGNIWLPVLAYTMGTDDHEPMWLIGVNAGAGYADNLQWIASVKIEEVRYA